MKGASSFAVGGSQSRVRASVGHIRVTPGRLPSLRPGREEPTKENSGANFQGSRGHGEVRPGDIT